MADINNDQERKTTVASPTKERKLSLTAMEAMAEVDKLKERVRSLSFSSTVSGESSCSDSGSSGTRPLVKKQDDLINCLSVMRRLMEQAESESKRMREEKVVIASKINSSLNAVNREVEYLKAELRDQDKRLSDLANSKLSERETKLNEAGASKSKVEIYKEDNERLRCENEFLTRELNEWRHGNTDLDQLRERLHSCEHEISRAKETISCMKIERKRLKTEKMNLLHQMKEVYGILEVKEAELREFIQNYEQRMLEGEEKVKRLETEKRVWEQERSGLSKESESLKSQLEIKDVRLKELENELFDIKQRFSSLESSFRENNSQLLFKSNNLNVDPTGGKHISNACNNKRTNSLQNLENSPRLPLENADKNCDCPPTLLISTVGSASSGSQSDVSQACSPPDIEVFDFSIHNNLETLDSGKKKKERPSSLSRFFTRGKQRKSLVFSPVVRDVDNTSTSFAEKKRVWELHKDIPMVCWKANMVLAWLEVECQMSVYSQMCYENIKSGKVLLELSDSELEAGLGIMNTMHRRKLRLAIEEYRDPAARKYPEISSVDHLWVARVWIKDLGLNQYSSTFEAQMIDGRLLNVLTKKDMEKYLNVNKKFHQTSVLHGIKLLRMMDFSKELLIERRTQSEDNDLDPVVWTNDRVAKWCRSIDLGAFTRISKSDNTLSETKSPLRACLHGGGGPQVDEEYADNLKDSGVHGAVLVLDPIFGADELAQALGIHVSKNIIRRHLTSELLSVLVPAREHMDFDDTDVKGKQKQKRHRSLSFNSGSRTSVRSEIKRHSFRDSFMLRSSSKRKPYRASSDDTDVSNVPYPAVSPRSSLKRPRTRPKSSFQ